MDWEGAEILVIGLGMTGRSAARYLAERGARVTAVDQRPSADLPDLSDLPPGVEVRAGAPVPDPAGFDVVVPSPGVPRERYAEGARRVLGDIELAWQALEVPVVAVTGTNGKSTTVRLIEAMLRAAGLRARAAGNVGEPALDLVGAPIDTAVIEVSSFQLEAVERFAPRVSVVLNVSPDHLDRHGDLAAYAATKANVLRRQGPDDVAVLNFDDPLVHAMAEVTAARVLPFSRTRPLEHGVFADAGAVVWRDAEGTHRASLEASALTGIHNLENTLAAVAAVLALGADPRMALRALADFRGLPHRCEVVARADGVTWVNDSKATNPGAALRSLESFDTPLLWIAGGRDKQLDFGPLADAAARHVRSALLVGEAAGQLEGVLAGRVPVERCGDLAGAVARAADDARPGDVVLLAPACASFDQFESFEARGDAFRDLVRARLEGASDGRHAEGRP